MARVKVTPRLTFDVSINGEYLPTANNTNELERRLRDYAEKHDLNFSVNDKNHVLRSAENITISEMVMYDEMNPI